MNESCQEQARILSVCVICSHTQFHKAWANPTRTMWQYFIFHTCVANVKVTVQAVRPFSTRTPADLPDRMYTPASMEDDGISSVPETKRNLIFSLSFITDTAGTEGYYLPASGTMAASQIWISSELSLLTNRLWNHGSVSRQSQPCPCPGNPEQLLPSDCHWPRGHISLCHPVHFRALIPPGHGLYLHGAGTLRGLSLPRVQWAQLNSGGPVSSSTPATSHLQGALAKKFFRNTPPVLNILILWWHLAPFAPASKFVQ